MANKRFTTTYDGADDPHTSEPEPNEPWPMDEMTQAAGAEEAHYLTLPVDAPDGTCPNCFKPYRGGYCLPCANAAVG